MTSVAGPDHDLVPGRQTAAAHAQAHAAVDELLDAKILPDRRAAGGGKRAVTKQVPGLAQFAATADPASDVDCPPGADVAGALLAPPTRIADNRPMILAPNQPLDALLRSLGIEAVCPWLPETRALMPREPAALS